MILLTCRKAIVSKRTLVYLLDQILHEKIQFKKKKVIRSFKNMHNFTNIVLTRQQKHSLSL